MKEAGNEKNEGDVMETTDDDHMIPFLQLEPKLSIDMFDDPVILTIIAAVRFLLDHDDARVE